MWKQRYYLKYTTFQEKYVYAIANEITCWSLMVVYTGHLLLTNTAEDLGIGNMKKMQPLFSYNS